MATATVSDKGAVVIPPDVRERYGLRTGSRVHIIDYGDVLALLPAAVDPVSASYGMLKGASSLTASWLARREGEAAHGTGAR